MKVDVLILYQHYNREFNNACILRTLLEKEGYKVKIIPIVLVRGLLNLKYKPKLIVSPACQTEGVVNDIRHTFVGANDGSYQILDLYSEQLSSISTDEIIKITGNALNIYHICWGKFTYNNLLKNNLSSKQIRITGSQRLDFVNGKIKKLFKTKSELASEHELNIKKKWILIPGNFSNKDEKNIKSLEQRGYYKFEDLVKLTQNTYDELLKWYKCILESDLSNNIELIYRPHPVEIVSKDLYALSDRFNNFHIINDYNISDWALNIDLAYIWTSTSSVELAFAGVPVLSMMPYELESYQRVRLVDEIEKVSNVNKLIELTREILFDNNKSINDSFKNKIKDFYEVSAISASEKIAEFIKDILRNDSLNTKIKSDFNVLKYIYWTIKCCVYLLLIKFHILPNRYFVVVSRDYRTQKYIEKFCENLKNKLEF